MKETHRRAFPPAADRFSDESPLHPIAIPAAFFVAEHIFLYPYETCCANFSWLSRPSPVSHVSTDFGILSA